MGATPHQDLGVVLEEPLPTLATREPTTYPHQRCGSALSRQIPHSQTTGVVDPSRLEPAPRTPNHPARVGYFDHQLLDHIHQHRYHADATQMQADGHSIGLHQGPFLARRL